MADILEQISELLTQMSQKISNHFSKTNSELSDLKPKIALLITATDAHRVIIGTTELDRALETAILTKMCQLSSDIKDKIFEGYGPLSTFAAKILMSYALGLITRDSYNSLTRINKIRVRFAHAETFVSFQDREIAKLIDSFPELDLAISDWKERFFTKISELMAHLGGLSATNDQTDVT